MSRRIDITVAEAIAAQWSGAGTNYLIQANNGSLYCVYIGSDSDVRYKKSRDGGKTWDTSVLAATAGTTTNLAVWYDRWSNIAADLIHMVFSDSGNDDTMYRTINTASSDALSTQTVIFAGASTAAGGHLSVTRAVGGNVYCKTVIDAGAEGGFYRLPNANVPSGAWDAARTVDETIATLDQMILLPDFDAADTQDIMAIFQDASVTEISRKLYDDSANTWSETSINASITELATSTAFPNLAAAPDISNTNHVLLVWTNTDTLNADLLCYTVDSGAITAKTDVVTNSTDDQGLCAIGIATDTGYWHAFYCGISTGGQTWPTAMGVYTKVSTDSGSTWGPETLYSTNVDTTIRWLTTAPRFTGKPVVLWLRDGQLDEILASVDITQPRASLNLGV